MSDHMDQKSCHLRWNKELLVADLVDRLRRELRDDYWESSRLAAGTLPAWLRGQVGFLRGHII